MVEGVGVGFGILRVEGPISLGFHCILLLIVFVCCSQWTSLILCEMLCVCALLICVLMIVFC